MTFQVVSGKRGLGVSKSQGSENFHRIRRARPSGRAGLLNFRRFECLKETKRMIGRRQHHDYVRRTKRHHPTLSSLQVNPREDLVPAAWWHPWQTLRVFLFQMQVLPGRIAPKGLLDGLVGTIQQSTLSEFWTDHNQDFTQDRPRNSPPAALRFGKIGLSSPTCL